MVNERTKSERIDRRTILQAVGAAGIAGIGMSGSVAGLERSDHFELSEQSVEENEFTVLSEHEETGKLVQAVQERDLDPDVENAIGINIRAKKDLPNEIKELSAREFNALNPRMVVVPFINSDGEAGILFSMTVVDHPGQGHGRGHSQSNGKGPNRDGNRTPVTAFATVSKIDEQHIGSMSGQSDEIPVKIDHLTFEEKEETEVGTASSSERAVEVYESVEKTVAASGSEEEDGVSAQSFHGVVSPAFCAGTVEEVCRRFGDDATRRQCVRLCVSRAGWNPKLAAACSAFCIVGVFVIQRYGCRTSGNVLCNTIFQVHDRVL